jgi:hypothetical protein
MLLRQATLSAYIPYCFAKDLQRTSHGLPSHECLVSLQIDRL